MKLQTIIQLGCIIGMWGLLQCKSVPQEGSKASDTPASSPTRAVTTSQPTFSSDSSEITAAVLAMWEAAATPAKEFRSGRVKPGEIHDYLSPTPEGFVIQLPQRGLTPSPTVYKNMLFVSGGFGSKSFYAFNAQTGEIIWAVELDDDGPSAAIAVDDRIILNTESCTIFVLNAFTGEMEWSHYLGDPLMSTPSIRDGRIFTAYPAGRGVGLLQQNNVEQQFSPSDLDFKKKPSPSPPDNSPDDFKYQLYPSHILVAMDLATGEVAWQRWIDGDIMSAPVAEPDELYVTTFPGTLFKFNPQSGELLAARASRATSAPVVVGDQIYMTQRADQASEVREAIGVMGRTRGATQRQYFQRSAPYLDAQVQQQTELKSLAADYDAGNGFSAGPPTNSGWEAASANIGQANVSSLQAFQGSRILHLDGKNYSTMGDEILCTDPNTGEVVWKQELEGDLQKDGGFLATPPLYAGGKLVIATLKGDIIVSNPNTGEELGRYKTGETIRYQPVVDQGRIYVSTMTGKVICIDSGDPSLTGWATWGANAAHTNRKE